MSGAVLEVGPGETLVDERAFEPQDGPTTDTNKLDVREVTASAVAAGLAKKLRLFAHAQVYAVVVRVIRIAFFFAGVSDVRTASLYN
jgi:hypothetical protein